MSHVTEVKTGFKELDVLDEALHGFGMELRRNQPTHAWWGRFVGDSRPPAGRDPKDYGKCLHAIGRIGHKPQMGSGGEWEIGLVEALDGNGLDAMFDYYGSAGRRITEPLGGEGLPKLRQAYAVALMERKAKKLLAPKGFVTKKEVLPSGTIRLRMVRR